MEREGLYSAKTVAKWFLYYNQAAIDSEDADLISNLKLQKLLYYAQGCYLAIKGKPLFFEKILAWAHGPVVNEVYQEYKHYHSNGIIYNGDYDNSIKKQDEELLEQVYEIFGQYSARGLRNKTHREAPWCNTEINQEIKQDVIKEYFENNYVTEN